MSGRLPFRPLFGFTRGGVLEVEVFGFYAAVCGDTLLTPGCCDAVIPSRSLLKPWQLAACVSELDDRSEWAIGMSSSSGEATHVAALSTLAQITGWDTEALVCPAAHSYHVPSLAHQIATGERPRMRYHFCCGKHLAVKHACARLGGEPADYFSESSPVHHRLSALVGQIMGIHPRWATDSCGLPTLLAPVRGHLVLWRSLGSSRSKELERVKRWWTEAPLLIGGTDRVDTMVIQAGGGQVLAKEGADGLIALQSLSTDASRRFTLILKLAQTASDALLITALRCVLERHRDSLPEPLHAVLDTLAAKDDSTRKPSHALVNLLHDEVPC